MLNSGLSLFFREIMMNPSKMGAIFPSFNRLANKISAFVPDESGFVVELGGGTGVITAALLAHGVRREKLIVVERAATLAAYLRKRFTHLNIIHGDASELAILLDHQYFPIRVIVSSLPLRSLPQNTVKAIHGQINQLLEAGGLYIQFTYGIFHKPLLPSAAFYCAHTEYSWLNLPPARIEVFCKENNNIY